MKRAILVILTVAFVLNAACQVKDDVKFNFDFELQENGFSAGWGSFGSANYTVRTDSATVRSGKYSAAIEHDRESQADFKALAFNLPENYEGRWITLSGYIRTEDVADGYAGLWMRIDPEVAFDNMGGRGVTGTTDWTKCEVTLTMDPARTTQIVIGGLLVGKGKMWLDDLMVTIDGKDISEASPYVKVSLPAEEDREFDKGSDIAIPFVVSKEWLASGLDLLGKVWGFMKYHHPEIGKGGYNWDYELFRVLPGYLKANTVKERDGILLDWINKYGDIPAVKREDTTEDAFLKPDFAWVEKSDMSPELKDKIMEIYRNRHNGEHFYIRMLPGVGNPEFTNENPYSEMSYPDAGFRLLSLYRYWNMIKYFFPNTYMTDKYWDDVLKEYVPEFIYAGSRLEYELAALRLIGEIHDTHANLWGGGHEIRALRGNMRAPFRTQFIEGKLVVTDYYNPGLREASGPEIGDVITHIDGKSVEEITDSLRIYYPASNEAAKLRDIADDMLRSAGKAIRLNYVSSGREKQKEQTLYKTDELDIYHWYKIDKNEKCYKFIDGNIGYVTLASIQNEDIPLIKDIFKDTKGMVIDIRNYPSAFVPFLLGSYFVSATVPFVKFTHGSVDNPGEFTFGEGPKIAKPKETYRGKLVVIVNEYSQSQAEYTAMAFRAGANTTIVGSTTAGADGNVSTILLPGGLRTMISGIGVYYPDGTETQRIGIVPDIVVEPTINGIRNGRDEVLEKAVEVINSVSSGI